MAVGRHNWLFAGSERGAQWAACLFSLLATCRIHRINPFAYFADVLRRVHTTPQQKIQDLTPRGWKQLREAQAPS